MAARYHLALSSNLGNRLANLQDAFRRLGDAVAIEAVSSLYETDSADPSEAPPSYSAACAGTTDLTPPELFALCGRIEWAMGRRPGPQSDLYPLTVDVLLAEDTTRPMLDRSPRRRRIDERPGILAPLAEIAPDLILPGGMPVRQTAEQMGNAGSRRIAGPEWHDAVAVAPPAQRPTLAANG